MDANRGRGRGGGGVEGDADDEVEVLLRVRPATAAARTPLGIRCVGSGYCHSPSSVTVNCHTDIFLVAL